MGYSTPTKFYSFGYKNARGVSMWVGMWVGVCGWVGVYVRVFLPVCPCLCVVFVDRDYLSLPRSVYPSVFNFQLLF